MPPISAAAGPLSGYRILDLTGVSGQFCGRLLAGLGAEVIKVEPPGGDESRRIPPFYRDEPHPERSLVWWVLNAGKRGLTLDITKPQGRDLLRRLAALSDAVIESAKPGVMAEAGLDLPALRKVNPTLVMTSITGFGHDGPYRDYEWSDIVCMALGGLMHLLGEAERPPVRMRPPQAYLTSNVQAATGAVIALYHRTRTGRGQRVDLAIQEAVTFNLNGPGSIVSFWTLLGQNIGRCGDRINFGHVRPRVLVPCKDGYTANAGGIWGRNFPPLLQVLQAEDAAGHLSDPKYLTASTYPSLPGQWRPSDEESDAAAMVFQRWQMRHTKAEIFKTAVENALYIYPVNTPADIVADVQLEERGFFESVRHPAFDRPAVTTGAPFRYSESPWVSGSRPPLLGEHNEQVYAGLLGLGPKERAGLKKAGVL